MLRKAEKFGFLIAGFAISVFTNCYALDDSAIKIKWGYKGNTGPAHWGGLSADFALCSSGKTQSPINITKKFTKAEQSLAINYEPAPMVIVDDGTTSLLLGKEQTIISDGHGVQLNFNPSNTKEKITVNDQAYQLVQFHMHSPSETKLNGQSYPLEIHFVHQGENGRVAVIGVLVKGGAANPALQKIVDHLPKEHGKEFVIEGERINPAELLPDKLSYYNFIGSLTTPPCTEGLNWLVMANPISASPAQIVMLRKAMGGDNARPIQSLNGRVISYISGSSS